MAQKITALPISCNLTHEERKALDIVAQSFGYSTTGMFVRDCILTKCKDQLASAVSLLDSFKQESAESIGVIQ